MDKKHENAVWVPHADTLPEPVAPGVTRRILAYNKGLMCVENTFEKGAVGGAAQPPPHPDHLCRVRAVPLHHRRRNPRSLAGDTMLKTDSVLHGCEALEPGVLLDIFTPMREDFV